MKHDVSLDNFSSPDVIENFLLLNITNYIIINFISNNYTYLWRSLGWVCTLDRRCCCCCSWRRLSSEPDSNDEDHWIPRSFWSSMLNWWSCRSVWYCFSRRCFWACRLPVASISCCNSALNLVFSELIRCECSCRHCKACWKMGRQGTRKAVGKVEGQEVKAE